MYENDSYAIIDSKANEQRATGTDRHIVTRQIVREMNNRNRYSINDREKKNENAERNVKTTNRKPRAA